MDLGTQAIIDQDYPSTLESVDDAEASVMSVAEQTGFDEDEQHRIGMAFRECMVNAASWWRVVTMASPRSACAMPTVIRAS